MTDAISPVPAIRSVVWRKMRRQKLFLLGAALLLGVVVAVVLLPLLLDLQPNRSQMRLRLQAPRLRRGGSHNE